MQPPTHMIPTIAMPLATTRVQRPWQHFPKDSDENIAAASHGLVELQHDDSPIDPGRDGYFPFATAPTNASILPTSQFQSSSSVVSQSGEESVQISAPIPVRARRKKSGVLAFLSLRESSSAALEQLGDKHNVDAKLRRATTSSIPRLRTSTSRTSPRTTSFDQQDLTTPEPYQTELPQVRTPRRSLHRPTMSMVADGPRSPRLTIGSLTSRPQSMAVRRGSMNQWPLSSSSSDTSTINASQSPRRRSSAFIQPPIALPEEPLLQSRFSDDSSIEASFVSEYRSSPIAVYLRSNTQSPTHVPDRPSLDAALPLPDSVQTPGLTPDSKQTFWYSDTDAEDVMTPLAIPVSRPDNVIYWSPNSHLESSLETSSTEVSEKEDWPLPSPQSRSHAAETAPWLQQSVVPSESAHHQHRHTFSSATTATVTTVVSPTFTADQAELRRTSTSSVEAELASEAAISNETQDVNDDQSDQDSLQVPPRWQDEQDDANSIAPSEMSVQWTQSPQQRLGLGGRIRKAEILPWEVEKLPAAAVRYVGEAPARRKSNRFSQFIGRARLSTL